MISEESCDTEDWNFSFAITRINYILQFFYNRSNKCSFGEHKRLQRTLSTTHNSFVPVLFCVIFRWKSYGFGRMGVSKLIFIFGWTFLLIPWQTTVTLRLWPASDKEIYVHTSPLRAITLVFTMKCSKGQTPSWFTTEFHLFLAFCVSLPILLCHKQH